MRGHLAAGQTLPALLYAFKRILFKCIVYGVEGLRTADLDSAKLAEENLAYRSVGSPFLAPFYLPRKANLLLENNDLIRHFCPQTLQLHIL
ncbi:hypothetical protein NDU88_006996 [Pleurodeles waltl]|uniref:Uncharacterized protein n=1 Tax=Pleurodeles waltl TaxID=8319 RepID=A0AAV7UN54_PLEWA|nr:hypothetical protein NDU88_006996 [Pleurodeles waltl]